MGKICDPPPFTGGQTSGVLYTVQIEASYDNGMKLYYIVSGNQNYTSSQPFPNNSPIRNIYALGSISELKYEQGPGPGSHYQIYSVISSPDSPIKNNIRIQDFSYVGSIRPVSVKIYDTSRYDNRVDTGGDRPPTNCRCTTDSCRVDCTGVPDGFCCIDRSFTDRLLQTLRN